MVVMARGDPLLAFGHPPSGPLPLRALIARFSPLMRLARQPPDGRGAGRPKRRMVTDVALPLVPPLPARGRGPPLITKCHIYRRPGRAIVKVYGAKCASYMSYFGWTSMDFGEYGGRSE